MPTLSASDYTQYIKMKAAAAAYTNGPPRAIQTVDQPVPNVNILNSIVLASQASFVANPSKSTIVGNTRVRPMPTNNVNNPNALSTVTYSTAGTGNSSKVTRPGGLPVGFKSANSTYTRLPQITG
jgi:hypothetical protein